MELATNYMGLELRNPLVASASPLSHTVDGVRRLADAGVGAVVLHSLFEEQLREEAMLNARLADAGTESFAESLSYFPSAVEDEPGPRSHLSLVERAAAAVDVPVIASLNCVTPGEWTEYARAMQDAGASAIELNIYYLSGDPSTPGRDVEQRYVDVLQRVKDAVTVPVAVKLGPYFSSTGEIVLRLDEAGADALVLFNRFMQPNLGRRGLRRRRRVPACGSGCGDERLGAAAPRTRARDRAARWAVRMDGAQGISVGRRAARHAVGSGRHRHDGIRARRVCHRAPRRQRPRLPCVVSFAVQRAPHQWRRAVAGTRSAAAGRSAFKACHGSAEDLLSPRRRERCGAGRRQLLGLVSATVSKSLTDRSRRLAAHLTPSRLWTSGLEPCGGSGEASGDVSTTEC